MVDVRQAASAATNYLVSLYPQQTHSNVQLEEVELTEDEKYWLITLSFPVPVKAQTGLDSVSVKSILNPPMKKEYKIFKIDTDTGKVRSMKIRKLD